MDILYFCSPPLLDYSAEQINDLKQHVNLHVVIWVALHSPNHTILKLNEQHSLKGIYTFDAIKDEIENADLFEEYFKGCESVHFLFFPAKPGLNIISLTVDLLKLTNNVNPEIIHLDDISGRLLLFVLFLRRQKLILNIHDPALHSGEANWFYSIMRKVIFKKMAAFCTFSKFSRQLFISIYRPQVPVVDLRLVPYYSYSLLGGKAVKEIKKSPNEKVLLFFGRISPYKGIDELLLAFSKVLQKVPNVKLVVAGTGTYQYNLPASLLYSPRLILVNRFITKNEIKSLFEQADVIICPYRDATQSGVLMTAAVFDLPAIVSNVGALPEYIRDGVNGYVYDLKDEMGLENTIMQFLTENRYLAKSVLSRTDIEVSRNSQLLVNLYSQLIAAK